MFVGNKFCGVLFRVIVPRATVMSTSHYEFHSAVRGFHEYQSIWAPMVCEELHANVKCTTRTTHLL